MEKPALKSQSASTRAAFQEPWGCSSLSLSICLSVCLLEAKGTAEGNARLGLPRLPLSALEQPPLTLTQDSINLLNSHIWTTQAPQLETEAQWRDGTTLLFPFQLCRVATVGKSHSLLSLWIRLIHPDFLAVICQLCSRNCFCLHHRQSPCIAKAFSFSVFQHKEITLFCQPCSGQVGQTLSSQCSQGQ